MGEREGKVLGLAGRAGLMLRDLVPRSQEGPKARGAEGTKEPRDGESGGAIINL